MTEQPRALQLVDQLQAEISRTVQLDMLHYDAAVELQRLHEAHDWQYKLAGDRLRRIEKLERINTDLKQALLWIACTNAMDYEYQRKALDTLAKIDREENNS